MKTTTLKSLITIAAICLMSFPLFAQTFVAMRIDVFGSRYSDQMWMFTVPTCTTGFDNGWDGYKMIGTNSYAPVIYAQEVSGNYQVDAVADFNNTNIAFRGGEDSQYTFSFYSENLATTYQHLYLLDLVANKTIDILNSGVTYTFAVNKATDPLLRFKIITSLPVVTVTPPDTTKIVVPVVPVDTVVAVVPPVVPVVPVDTVVAVVPPVVPVVPVDTVVAVVPPVVPVVPVDTVVAVIPPVVPVVPVVPVDTVVAVVPPVVPVVPVVTKDNNGKNEKGQKDEKDEKGQKEKKEKKLKISCSQHTIRIENTGKGKGHLQIYNAVTGRMVEVSQINSNGETIYQSKSPKGTYVVRGTTTDDDVTETVIIR